MKEWKRPSGPRTGFDWNGERETAEPFSTRATPEESRLEAGLGLVLATDAGMPLARVVLELLPESGRCCCREIGCRPTASLFRNRSGAEHCVQILDSAERAVSSAGRAIAVSLLAGWCYQVFLAMGLSRLSRTGLMPSCMRDHSNYQVLCTE